jgi:uncharacterized membrane protein YuzA (DUF378 family)
MQIEVHYIQSIHGRPMKPDGRTREEVMKPIDTVAAALVIVGALNWGVVAIARVDLVAALFGMRVGEVSPLSAVVYGLVGLAAAYQALFWKRVQTRRAQPASVHAR